jgi:hypothetical protein
MVRLLKGVFGSWNPYCLQDFEAVPIGDITGTITLPGEVDSGDCRFLAAQFGSR